MNTFPNPFYRKQVKDRLEAASTKQASIAFRKKLFDQNRMNYQSAYERIRSILNHSSLPSVTVEGLKQRKEQLKALGAKAFSLD